MPPAGKAEFGGDFGVGVARPWRRGSLVSRFVGDAGFEEGLAGGDDGEIELLDHVLEVVFLGRAAGGLMDSRDSFEGLAEDLKGVRVHEAVCGRPLAVSTVAGPGEWKAKIRNGGVKRGAQTARPAQGLEAVTASTPEGNRAEAGMGRKNENGIAAHQVQRQMPAWSDGPAM